jgi:hypothetical protein
MNDLWWELPPNSTQGCEVDGIPLDCHIHIGGTEVRGVRLWMLGRAIKV